MKFFVVISAAIIAYASAAPRRLRTVKFGRDLHDHPPARSMKMDVKRSERSMVSTETLMTMSYSLPQSGPAHSLPSTPFPSGGDGEVQVMAERDVEDFIEGGVDIANNAAKGIEALDKTRQITDLKLKHIVAIVSLVVGFCLFLVNGISVCVRGKREVNESDKREENDSDERAENAFSPS